MDVQAFFDMVRAQSWYSGQVVDDRTLPPREAVAREPETPLHPALVARLEELGQWPLYAHQAEAIEAVLGGENVVVSTPTASGKSLCFQVPVLHDWLNDRVSRALFLYPTKALTQDQLGSLNNLASFGRSPTAAIYDGDTPNEERRRLRSSAHVLMTNPDMLHMGILPHHPRLWKSFFTNLRTVVVDEAHYFRGVFGSHVAMVLRRLRRVCARYGATPRFILCSATIGNPRELAENLVGEPFTAVTESGAPVGEKRFWFWNPPLLGPTERRASDSVDSQEPGRTPPHRETARLLVEAVRRDIRTLAFVRSRILTELVIAAAKDNLQGEDSSLAERMRPYRGTYLPRDRRRIEADLKNGTLLGVAATNALELGMDIGGLDTILLTGYPGSVASAWQQAGRAGRRGDESLAVLVANDDPLDQYLMHHPEFFYGRPMEHALVATENPVIFSKHLLCAAYEMPLTEGDKAYWGPALERHVDELERLGDLHKHQWRWHLSPSIEYPAGNVNLRSITDRMFQMVDSNSGAVLEEGMDDTYVYSHLHEGAVYLHQGKQYMVRELDLESGQALVTQRSVNYYTESSFCTDIRVLEDLHNQRVESGIEVVLSKVEVTRRVMSYQKISFQDERKLGEAPVHLPPVQFTTVALRFGIPPALADRDWDLAGGLHAAEHAAIGVLPLFALCDRADIGGVSTPMHPDTGQPTVFIYDGYPGGIGIAERGYEAIEALWRTTLQAIAECPCSEGCPACVQSPKCGNNNHPLDKAVAAELLRGLLNVRG